MLFLKRLVVICMAFLNFLPLEWIKYDDSCKGHEFPRIAAKMQEAGTLRVMSFNIRCADVNGVVVKKTHRHRRASDQGGHAGRARRAGGDARMDACA